MIHEILFVGAGPGDPDLITVKGRRAVENADTIIYAGSLVNPGILSYNKKEAAVYNSASMTLEEVLDVMKKSSARGERVVRLHTGDPSLYGAVKEQMDALDEMKIPYTVIPGVSSFQASAAALQCEFTLPGVSQTLICTRLEGRTPVPEKESLELLAIHHASMAVFLSVHMLGNVVARLTEHYPVTTPAAVVERASWPEEKVVRGTLADIEEKVAAEDIKKTAIIFVGDFLDSAYERSKLYDASFSHEYRDAT